MIAALMSHGNIIPSERLTKALTMAYAKAVRYYGGDTRRVQRALRLCCSGCVDLERGRVQSEGNPELYYRATQHTCECAAHARGAICKHMIAVAMARCAARLAGKKWITVRLTTA